MFKMSAVGPILCSHPNEIATG